MWSRGMAEGEGAPVPQAISGSPAAPSTVQRAHGVSVNHGNVVLAGGNVTFQTNYHGHPQPSINIADVLCFVPNLRKIHLDVLSKTTPGTAVWILKTENFVLWLDPSGNLKILWGTGIPGAGKSVMALVVISDLEARAAASGGSICVAYIYFRYSDATNLTVRGVLEILVKQTVERHPDCATLAEQAYARHLKEKTQPTEAELLQLLHQFTEVSSATFYVLDALDEAPTKLQADIVRTLATLDIKLFITSRPLRAIEAKISGTHGFTIVAQDDDLDLHIAREISRSCDLEDLLDADPSFREEVIASVKKNCDGMFLHASLQLDAIARCSSAHDVIETLEHFPSDIDDVYHQTWSRISGQSPKNLMLAKVVLVWVLNAARSMTIEELQRAIATHPDTHKFERKRLVSAATLLTLCCGLVAIEEATKVVRLVHYTAKDILQQILRETFPHPHSLLAAVCMTHLAECGFQDTAIGSVEEFTAALQGDPLLAYASDAWATHARNSLDLAQSSHRTSSFVSKCKAFPSYTYPGCTVPFDIFCPLHVLAHYNLPIHLLPCTEIGDPNIATRTEKALPSMLACWSNNEDMVQRLFGLQESDINLSDKDGWTVLMFSTFYGREGISQLLLGHLELQVNLVDNQGHSALMKAAHFGSASIAELLLGHHEIQVNLVGDHGQSALMLAANEGHEGIVALLLVHSEIQVNLVDSNGCSALMTSAHFGHENIVKLLLAHPATQVNLVGDERWSALMKAASRGHEGIVKLLLAHPAIQVNLVGDKGWLALTTAASWGHEKIVELLIAHPDTLVNLAKNDGWSALMRSACFGHEKVVKLLLAHPAIQVNLADNEGWSALMMAVYEGHEGVVKLLLEHPAIQVDLTSINGETALTLAVEFAHEGVIQLLSAHCVGNLAGSPPDGEAANLVASGERSESPFLPLRVSDNLPRLPLVLPRAQQQLWPTTWLSSFQFDARRLNAEEQEDDPDGYSSDLSVD